MCVFLKKMFFLPGNIFIFRIAQKRSLHKIPHKKKDSLVTVKEKITRLFILHTWAVTTINSEIREKINSTLNFYVSSK